MPYLLLDESLFLLSKKKLCLKVGGEIFQGIISWEC
jgi:hypothetical protein